MGGSSDEKENNIYIYILNFSLKIIKLYNYIPFIDEYFNYKGKNQIFE